MPWVLAPRMFGEGFDGVNWGHVVRDGVPGWAAFWRPMPAPPHRPVRLTVTSDHPLPDFIQGPIVNMLLVSDRFRTLVEEFEPGHHHFLDIELCDAAGRALPATHWLWKPGPGIPGAIVPEESNVTYHEFGAHKFYLLTGVYPDLVWHADRIDGRHVWTDVRLMGEPCVSDEFHAELLSRGLTGVRFFESPAAGAPTEGALAATLVENGWEGRPPT